HKELDRLLFFFQAEEGIRDFHVTVVQTCALPIYAFSARDVIAAIRKRAGIAQPDNFLASIQDKDEFRELIRNERRLELCFEGFRFWDLRRWKTDLSIPAQGVKISNGVYDYFNVEVDRKSVV